MATLTLISSDNEKVTVERQVMERSELIKSLLTDLEGGGGAGGQEQTAVEVPVPNVNHNVLKKVIEWCEHHRNDPMPPSEEGINGVDDRKRTTEFSDFDAKFLSVDQELLFEIILAANYLDIKALLDVACRAVAMMIKDKSPEEIRRHFNIQNDFTPEEEDAIRRENEWAEDK